MVQENENADHLDLLGGSCLLLARIAPSLTSDERRTLEQSVRELAETLAAVAGDLGGRETRQRAADRALAVGTSVAGSDAAPDSALASGVLAVRMLAIDLIVFAGVALDDAIDAVREGILEHGVSPPPAASRGILGRLRSLRRRRTGGSAGPDG